MNRLFYENTADESYATMFFGVYDDSCRSLRFANCGHIAPLILRSDGSIRRLTSTTTVVGLFQKWEAPSGKKGCTQGSPGDLHRRSDRAPNRQAEEHGEMRLAELIRENKDSPVTELLAAVQEFSGATQADDITVIVARC